MRFPGQFADAEDGLFYNWHRDYDPTTGRYLQPDPIGLAGGLNLYSYANQNSQFGVDRLGLKVMVCRDPTFNGRIPFAKHYWITTDTQSAGMGTLKAEENTGNPYDYLGSKVHTTSHKKREDKGDRECAVAKGADEEKVNKLIKPGRSLGGFWLGRNDCQSFVRNVLKETHGEFPFE